MSVTSAEETSESEFRREKTIASLVPDEIPRLFNIKYDSYAIFYVSHHDSAYFFHEVGQVFFI